MIPACPPGADAYSFWDRNKTFKPERQLPAGSKAGNLQHTMQATMKATLGGGELQNTVKLPEGEDVSGTDTLRMDAQWAQRRWLRRREEIAAWTLEPAWSCCAMAGARMAASPLAHCSFACCSALIRCIPVTILSR